jgi:hypothetical protein
MRWKVVLIVIDEHREEVDSAVSQLFRLGYEDLHIFAGPKTKINKRRDIIVHQSPSYNSLYAVWHGAITIMASTYAVETDLFMFVRPNVRLWEQLPVYCEKAVDTEVFGVWSPYTPNKTHPDDYQERPKCQPGFGWCPSVVTGSLIADHCLVVPKHTATLLAAYLPQSSEMGVNAAGSIAATMARYSLPMYFHIPSLVNHQERLLAANDFVGVSFTMQQSSMAPTVLAKA